MSEKYSKRLKVVTVLGTRPEIIRLSRVIATLDRELTHVLVHTGQNYDYELNEVFFEDLELRKPDYFLAADPTSLGSMLGNILIEVEKVLAEERPDALLVLGDTNSSIAALMAKRMKIPVYHMEAGNRCFDVNVPEEINRKLVDGLADFNLVYTEHARRHLLGEGFQHRRIYLTGSPMKEVLDYYSSAIENSEVLTSEKLKSKEYFLVSVHREENVDNGDKLRNIIAIINSIAEIYGYPVLVSTHPRTRNRLDALGDVSLDERVILSKPFGFHDYNKLQKNAFCVISDSGTISEESSLLSFPAITIRQSIERPESMDTGSIVVTGHEHDVVLAGIEVIVGQYSSGNAPPAPADYLHDNVSQRVLNLITGTARLSARWDGLERHDFDLPR